MKQALVEGAVPIPGITMYEQGQGKLDLGRSKVQSYLPTSLPNPRTQIPFCVIVHAGCAHFQSIPPPIIPAQEMLSRAAEEEALTWRRQRKD